MYGGFVKPQAVDQRCIWTNWQCNMPSLHAAVEMRCHGGIHFANLDVQGGATRRVLECRHKETDRGPDKNAGGQWRVDDAGWSGKSNFKAAEWMYSKDNRASGHLEDAMRLMSNEVGFKWSWYLSFVCHVLHRRSSFQFSDMVTIWCLSKKTWHRGVKHERIKCNQYFFQSTNESSNK